jgi:23S rRNA pseudouridine955/2504/2580 synthase
LWRISIRATNASLTANNPTREKQQTESTVKHLATAIISILQQKASPLSTPTVQLITVDASSEGQRLDNFLIKTLKGVPKTHIYRIIRSGEVRVNKGRVQAEHRLALGEVVRIPPVRTATPAQENEWVPSREFPILYEDDHVLVIDKPAGVAVHGGSGVAFGVIEQLRQARPESQFLELVHRLDRDTSGILLIAKRRSALTRLQDQFRGRVPQKRYLALVKGKWPASLRVIDIPLFKYLTPAGERRVRAVAADHPQAMRSISLTRLLAHGQAPGQAGEASLLEVHIKTGRTHQIRVHVSHSGHPIALDDKYGDEIWNQTCEQAGLKRMFLHAWKLVFEHPANNETIELKAPLPMELRNWSLDFVD